MRNDPTHGTFVITGKPPLTPYNALQLVLAMIQGDQIRHAIVDVAADETLEETIIKSLEAYKE